MSKRTAQAAELIQQKLSAIISREIELPPGVLITLTKVEISADLKFTKVWLVITPVEQVGKIYGMLRKQSKKLRQQLAEELNLQFVPTLNFRVDKSGMAVEEVEGLLEKIRKEEK